MKKLAAIQYPKLLALCFSILSAYLLFQLNFFNEFAEKLNSHGYISVFLAGVLFSYGFTSPFAVGFFVALSPSVNITLGAFLAGLGAVISDLLIFKFIRFSFRDEFNKLKLTHIFQKLASLTNLSTNHQFKKYALFCIAGFLIASPLPDEFGVSLISGFTKIDSRSFAAIAYFFNTIGILCIFAIARLTD